MTQSRASAVFAEVIYRNQSATRASAVFAEVIYTEDKYGGVSKVVTHAIMNANDAEVSKLVTHAIMNATDSEVSKLVTHAIMGLGINSIFQVSLEVIHDINPINTETLKLCLPFDQTLGESFTVDEGPSLHPIDLTTGGLPTIESSPSQFGGGALDVSSTDYARVLLPQPDFDFDGDFTIEFWIFKN